ncbi:hypothetical protein Tco_1192235 [Tanacetum coccineum]
MLKFLVPGRILTLRSSRIILLECMMVSRSETQPSDVIQATEERIKVVIHPEYPEQTIAIGSTQTEEGRKAFETPPERPRRMPSGQTKEKNPSTIKEQGNTRGSRKTCRHWHNEGSPLPQLVVRPEIDWKLESLYGYPFKCFLDAYKGYNQIKMAKEDEEKTAFITSQGIFCYSKIPFGLKNVRATYQRLVDKAFQK